MGHEQILITSGIACLYWAVTAVLDESKGKKRWIAKAFLAILVFILVVDSYYKL